MNENNEKSKKNDLGQETVLIRNDDIVERFSSLYNALLDVDGEHMSDFADLLDDRDDETELDLDSGLTSLLNRNPHEDQYDVVSEISQGGMGVLYQVFDKNFRRNEAMKVLLPEYKYDKALLKSFLREARITAQLEHPNIIPVHDLGELPGYGVYFTMKKVQGETLNDILNELESENPAYIEKYDYFSLLAVFRKVCDAVSYAHSQGILHRDIKPHNIMVGDFGEVILMDWGLAKEINEESEEKLDLTITEYPLNMNDTHLILKGSPGYMSPEQAGDGDTLDIRSDIFLLGATLYHIFTFIPPYIGTSIQSILDKARACRFKLPINNELSHQSIIPDDVMRIIQKAMNSDKQLRYQSVVELIQDLDLVIHGKMNIDQKHIPAEEVFINEGDFGNECYIILNGSVAVYKGNWGDGEVMLSKLSKGDIVGEMALITNAARSASVRTLEDTNVIVIEKDIFNANLNRLPKWMGGAFNALATRLNELDEKMARINHTNES
ncbi:MAG: serine/threonine-protein kinase [Lentisphaeria bacterium]|nr:serine/threonine-protein kinase [Lentisphaeria bacterium]